MKCFLINPVILSLVPYPVIIREASGTDADQPDILQQVCKLEISVFLTSWSTEKLAEVGEKRLYESEELEDTGRPWLSESPKQGSNGLTETEEAVMVPTWFFIRSLYVCQGHEFVLLVGLLKVRLAVSDFFCMLLGLFSSCWVVMSNFNVIILLHLIFYFAMFACYFSKSSKL